MLPRLMVTVMLTLGVLIACQFINAEIVYAQWDQSEEVGLSDPFKEPFKFKITDKPNLLSLVLIPLTLILFPILGLGFSSALICSVYFLLMAFLELGAVTEYGLGGLILIFFIYRKLNQD